MAESSFECLCCTSIVHLVDLSCRYYRVDSKDNEQRAIPAKGKMELGVYGSRRQWAGVYQSLEFLCVNSYKRQGNYSIKTLDSCGQQFL